MITSYPKSSINNPEKDMIYRSWKSKIETLWVTSTVLNNPSTHPIPLLLERPESIGDGWSSSSSALGNADGDEKGWKAKLAVGFINRKNGFNKNLCNLSMSTS